MRRPSLLAFLALVQVAAVVVLGAVTVERFHVFAEIDETAHVAYVQEVAEEGRLPVAGRDLVSPDVQAINDGTFPRRSPRPVTEMPFGGLSWEAHHPPLSYLVAAPAFAAAPDARAGVTAVRALDVVLLLGAVGLLALLARAVSGARWLAPFCLAMAVLLWPGVLVRAVTVSPTALELALTLAYLLALWRATVEGSRRWLLGAGALLGLCLLTKLTLVFLAPLLLVPLVRAVRERALGAAAGAAVLPGLVLAPWVVSNLDRYGALTPSEVARRVHEPPVNPTGERYGLDELAGEVPNLADAVLPQEWWGEYGTALGWGLRALAVGLVVFAIVPLVRRPALLREPGGLLLATPAPLVLGLLTATLLIGNWALFLPRFAYPALLPLALFAAWAWRRERVVAIAAAVATAVIFLVWIRMAGAYYFVDVGASLGIEAPPRGD